MIDASEALTAFCALGKDVVTGERRIRYLRECKIDTDYIIVTKIEPPKRGSRKVSVDVVLESIDGTPHIRTETTLVIVRPPQGLKDHEEKISRRLSKL